MLIRTPLWMDVKGCGSHYRNAEVHAHVDDRIVSSFNRLGGEMWRVTLRSLWSFGPWGDATKLVKLQSMESGAPEPVRFRTSYPTSWTRTTTPTDTHQPPLQPHLRCLLVSCTYIIDCITHLLYSLHQ